ncbi:MAG TPA: metal ABC transporter permease [Hyphomicrobiales bacterium]|nr:metal ABC transporter permease [Hyphomicrobiales bacterium]
MLEWLSSPFDDFGFMRRALVGCVAMAVGGTPVGVFMTLRNMSLTGDAMAHAILPGAAIGYLLHGLSLLSMTVGGIAAGLAVALLAGFVTRSSNIREDTNLAAFYLISLALGVLLVSSRGNSVDLQHVLFGSILALDDATLFLLAGIACLSLNLLLLFYRPLVLECCDPDFMRSESRLSAFVHYLFLALVVLNLVAGFHAIGTLMAVGMMILPAAAARFWVRQLDRLILTAVGLCLLGSCAGLLFSYYVDVPSSASIILCLGLIYLLSYLLGSAQGQWQRWFPRPHLEG